MAVPETDNAMSDDFAAEKAAILSRIRTSESGGKYDILAGGGAFQGYDKFPEWPGMLHTYEGKVVRSHGAGAYQFEPGTWRGQAKKLGLSDFSPANQDAGALDLAITTYKENTGRDLLADQRDGKVNWTALKPQWNITSASAPQGEASVPVVPQRQLAAESNPLLGQSTPVGANSLGADLAATGQRIASGPAGNPLMPPLAQQPAVFNLSAGQDPQQKQDIGSTLSLLKLLLGGQHKLTPVDYDPFKYVAKV